MIILALFNFCFMTATNAMDKKTNHHENTYCEADRNLIARMPQIMQDIYKHPHSVKASLKQLLNCMRTPGDLSELQALVALQKLSPNEWNKIFNENKSTHANSTWEETMPKIEIDTAIRYHVYSILQRQRVHPLSPTTMKAIASDVCNVIRYDQKSITPPFNSKYEIEALEKIANQLDEPFPKHFSNCLKRGFSRESERSMLLVKKCQNIVALIYTEQHINDEKERLFLTSNLCYIQKYIEDIIICSTTKTFSNNWDYKNLQITAQAEKITQSFISSL